MSKIVERVGVVTLAFILACAACGGIALVVGIVSNIYADNQRITGGGRNEELLVDEGGRPWIVMRNFLGKNYSGKNDPWLDADRKPINASVNPSTISATVLRGDAANYRNSFSPLLAVVQIGVTQNPDGLREKWYFVREDIEGARGWFEGYEEATRKRIGCIGTSGLKTTRPTPGQEFSIESPNYDLPFLNRTSCISARDLTSHVSFDEDYAIDPDEVYLISHGRLYAVALGTRTAVTPLNSEHVVSIGVANRRDSIPPESQRIGPNRELQTVELRQYIAARTSDKIHLLHAGRGEHLEFTIPDAIRDRSFSLYLMSDQTAIATFTPPNGIIDDKQGRFVRNQEVLRFTPDGQLVSESRVRIESHYLTGGMGMRYWRNTYHLAVPAPLVNLTMASAVFQAMAERVPITKVIQHWPRLFAEVWPSLVLNFAATIFCAFLTARWQTQHRLPRSYGWIAFVLLFGLPGYIGYRLHRRWPVRNPAPPPARLASDIFA